MVGMIHRIWFGPREMPERYRDFGQKWAELHPDWEVKDWGYHDLPPLQNQWLFDSVFEKWGGIAGAGKQNSAKQVQQADIAAYELVHQLGGLYVNCDIEPLRPLDELLHNEAWVVRSPHARYVSNAVMYAPRPGDAVFGEVVETLPRFISTRLVRAMNKQTGPSLLTFVIDKHPEFLVRPAEWFHPFSYYEMEKAGASFPEAYTKHHWGHQVLDENLWPGTEPEKATAPRWLLEAGAILHAMGITITEEHYQLVRT